MFTIWADTNKLYDPSTALYAVQDPILTMELNQAGSLEFSIPPTNPNYSSSALLKSRIRVKNDNAVIWEGHVLSHEFDYYKNKRVICEGRLAELKDVLFPFRLNINSEIEDWSNLTLPDVLAVVFDVYNLRADTKKQIALGDCDFTTIKRRNGTAYPDASQLRGKGLLFAESYEEEQYTLGGALDDRDGWAAFEKLSNTGANPIWNPLEAPYNGYMVPDYSDNDELTINFYEDSGEVSDQTIEFGKNLLDITQYIDSDGVFTAAIPLYYSNEDWYLLTGNVFQSIVSYTPAAFAPDTWFVENATGISLYGRIEKYLWYKSLSTAAAARTQATRDLAAAIIANTTITISAADLSLIDVNVDALNLGDYVEVISTPHSLDAYFQMTKVELHLQQPESNVYTFGSALKTITGYVEQNTEDLKKWVTNKYS